MKEGKLELAKDKTLRKPDHAGCDHRPLPALVARASGSSGRTRRRPGPTRSTSRAEAGRDASSGDEVVVKITKRPKRPGMNPEGRIVQVLARASGALRRHLLRGRRRRLRQGRRHDVPRPDLRGRPRRQGGQARRQGRARDRPLPDARTCEGEGVITEILGQRGQPGVDTLSVIRAFNIPDTFDEAVLDEAREQAKQFYEDEIGDRLDLRDVLDRDDRPGHRPRLRRRDLPVARRARATGAWASTSPTSRTSSGRLGARPRRPGSGARASTCPTA